MPILPNGRELYRILPINRSPHSDSRQSEQRVALPTDMHMDGRHTCDAAPCPAPPLTSVAQTDSLSAQTERTGRTGGILRPPPPPPPSPHVAQVRAVTDALLRGPAALDHLSGAVVAVPSDTGANPFLDFVATTIPSQITGNWDRLAGTLGPVLLERLLGPLAGPFALFLGDKLTGLFGPAQDLVDRGLEAAQGAVQTAVRTGLAGLRGASGVIATALGTVPDALASLVKWCVPCRGVLEDSLFFLLFH